jgi:hypothetical protein
MSRGKNPMNFKFPTNPNEEFWSKTGGEFQSGPPEPKKEENPEKDEKKKNRINM